MNIKILIIGFLASQHLMAQSYKTIHTDAILVDTHNDFLTQTMEKNFIFDTDLKGKTHSDLKRMKQGGVDVQFFSCFPHFFETPSESPVNTGIFFIFGCCKFRNHVCSKVKEPIWEHVSTGHTED